MAEKREAQQPEKAPAIPSSSFGCVQYTFDERKFLQDSLADKLPQEFISKRQGPGGSDVHYIETWRAIELANQTFGFNGWSSSIIEITQDYLDQTPSGRFNAGISSIVRISLKDGSHHEDIGYGTSDNQKHKGAALEHAKKKAVSDALKRALKNFGNKLGLTIYDRDHIKLMKRQTTKKPAPVGNKVNPHFVIQQMDSTQISSIDGSSSQFSSIVPSQTVIATLASSSTTTAPGSEPQEHNNNNIGLPSALNKSGNVHVKQEEEGVVVVKVEKQVVNNVASLGKLAAPPRVSPVMKTPAPISANSQSSSPPNLAMPKAPPRAPPRVSQSPSPRPPIVAPVKFAPRQAPPAHTKRTIAEANTPTGNQEMEPAEGGNDDLPPLVSLNSGADEPMAKKKRLE